MQQVLGTPVHMLQIPPAVMQLIAAKLENAQGSRHAAVHFTQDGKTLEQLKAGLGERDARCANASDVEVRLKALYNPRIEL